MKGTNMSQTTSRKVRLNADLAPDVAEALKTLAESRGVTLSEAVRRAISTEAYIYKKQLSGGKVLLKEKDQIKELVFL